MIYIVIHIYKTAGQTLFANFTKNFASEKLLPMYVGPIGLDTDKNIGSSANPGWVAERVYEHVIAQARPETRCAFGHMAYYGMHDLIKGKEPRYITFFRDPVERIISLYYYLRYGSTNFWHREIVEQNLSLEDWLNTTSALWIHNGQVRQLLIGSYPEIETQRELGNEYLEEAKRRLRAFWYVGLTETFETDVSYLYGKLGFLRFHSKSKVNVTPRKEVVSPHIRQMILERNVLDKELYQYALQYHADQAKRAVVERRYYRAKGRFMMMAYERLRTLKAFATRREMPN